MAEGDEKIVLEGAGTHLFRKYVDMRQVTVMEWVALQTIFDIVREIWVMREGGDSR